MKVLLWLNEKLYLLHLWECIINEMMLVYNRTEMSGVAHGVFLEIGKSNKSNYVYSVLEFGALKHPKLIAL